MNERIYLDWNATAPLRKEARAAALAALDLVGNASAPACDEARDLALALSLRYCANSIENASQDAGLRADGVGRGDGAAVATGNVNFVDTTTNTDLGSFPLRAGIARQETSALTAGAHIIAATYVGAGNLLASSAIVDQTITPARK